MTLAFSSPSPFVLSLPRVRHCRAAVSRCRCSSTSSSEIHSTKNVRVKEARSLLQRRHRERRNLILLEGQRLVQDALNAGVKPEQLYMTTTALERYPTMVDIRDTALKNGTKSYIVTEAVMQCLSDTITPQGVIAVCKRPQMELPSDPTLLLVIDGVHDPGNLGTLIRSAAASGADAVTIIKGSADAWGMKALRAGMGAQFHVTVHQGMTWEELSTYALETGLSLNIASGNVDPGEYEESATPIAYWDIDWQKPSALVIGSEAHGASKEAFETANGQVVYIPMAAQVESLNAGMAGTIILFEASRQRR